jgi:hypothetical protein
MMTGKSRFFLVVRGIRRTEGSFAGLGFETTPMTES